MAEFDDDAQKPNGSFAEVTDDDDLTLYLVLRRIMAPIFAPDTTSDAPRLRRFRISLAGNFPLLPKAIRNSARHVALWTRRGSPLRALLVISVGMIALLAVTGLLVFMLFFLAATFNAIVISLLMSLAAAGGFLALFFAFVTAIYIGALSVAVVVISTTTISAIIAVIITTGWIGFLWTVWLVTKRSVAFAKHSLGMSG